MLRFSFRPSRIRTSWVVKSYSSSRNLESLPPRELNVMGPFSCSNIIMMISLKDLIGGGSIRGVPGEALDTKIAAKSHSELLKKINYKFNS